MMVRIPPQDASRGNVEIVGEVPVTDKQGGNVIGTAKMEKLKGGNIVAHVELSPEHSHLIAVGFRLGEFSIVEDDEDDSTS